MNLLENGYILEFPEGLTFTDDEFFAFCQKNPELNIERDKHQNLIIMSPSGSLSDHFSHLFSAELEFWNRKNKQGIVFGSSSGFTLPDGSMKSPDSAWISKGKWDRLTREQKMKFAPVCPEFVVEVKSPSDSLNELKKKMKEWMKNGVKLGWLIDIEEQRAYIYNESANEKIIQGFDKKLSGENVLPGFEFDLAQLSDQ